jgi:hypothetical protein
MLLIKCSGDRLTLAQVVDRVQSTPK